MRPMSLLHKCSQTLIRIVMLHILGQVGKKTIRGPGKAVSPFMYNQFSSSCRPVAGSQHGKLLDTTLISSSCICQDGLRFGGSSKLCVGTFNLPLPVWICSTCTILHIEPFCMINLFSSCTYLLPHERYTRFITRYCIYSELYRDSSPLDRVMCPREIGQLMLKWVFYASVM